jgi:predicted ATPase
MPHQVLQQCSIKGFKSIEDGDVTLGPLNVLIGANGAGKSNLASFFKMLRSLAVGAFQTFVGRSGGANALLYFGAKRTLRIESKLKLHLFDAEVNYDFRLEFGGGDVLAITNEAVNYRRSTTVNGKKHFEHRGRAHPEVRFESFFGEEARSDRSEFPALFRMLERCRVYHFDDTTAQSRIRQHCDIDDNHFLHEDGRNLAAFLYKLHETMPTYYQLIIRHVRLVAPFFDTFILLPNALNPRTIMLRWREVNSDEEFGAHVLSDGTLRFIALAALLLQPPEDLPPVVFIDEPELGLHPYALAVLASLLRQAANHSQIIVATQSPTLLDHFEPQDVIVVDRVNGATEFRRKSPEELAEWLEEYTLSELWYKNVLGGSPSR